MRTLLVRDSRIEAGVLATAVQIRKPRH